MRRWFGTRSHQSDARSALLWLPSTARTEVVGNVASIRCTEQFAVGRRQLTVARHRRVASIRCTVTHHCNPCAINVLYMSLREPGPGAPRLAGAVGSQYMDLLCFQR